MSLLTDYDLTQDADYIKRVTSALYVAIEAVAQENSTGNLTSDVRRKDLVSRFIANESNERQNILNTTIALTLTNATIAAASDDVDPNATLSDGDIQFVVNSLINTLAGINANNSNL